MNLETYLETNNFEKKDLTILFSVGCVLNVENGDTYPLMADSSIDFSDDERVNIVTDDLDEYWWETLGTWNGDKQIVEDTHLRVLQNNIKEGRNTITDEEVDWLESKAELAMGI